jgi:hypothetical protein
MDTPESLIAAPLAISIFFGAQAILRGRNPGDEVAVIVPELAATVPVEPLLLLGTLATLLVTGGILVAIEMRSEARDEKNAA